MRFTVVKEFVESTFRNELCITENINESFSKILCFQGLFICREFLEKNQIEFPPFKLAEDICFDYMVHIHCNRIEMLDKITYHWVQYPVPFNRHKYDDFKARIDMLYACRYLIDRMYM